MRGASWGSRSGIPNQVIVSWKFVVKASAAKADVVNRVVDAVRAMK